MLFRDRDAPITTEGLILRTYGYDHPHDSCFCDVEYAPETLYTSEEPKALRDGRGIKYYKFYSDSGLRFIRDRFPQYQIPHRSLGRQLIGIRADQLGGIVKPDLKMKELMISQTDALSAEATDIIDAICDASDLRPEDFGVFGSLAHGFHNEKYSDLDLIIYGKRQLKELQSILSELYKEGVLINEFDSWTPAMPPMHWNFVNYSKSEYGWYQRRKLTYALIESEILRRPIKIEFEPVRRWEEIDNEFDKTLKIDELGRVEAVVEIQEDDESGFMPSIYPIKLKKIDKQVDPIDVTRITSYVEEFRLQVRKGERAVVRGNLERVESTNGEFYQIVLSYGTDYFDQVLKAIQ